MKTKFLYLLVLAMVAIGGQTVPKNKPIGTNPGTEKRPLIATPTTEIGGQQTAPRIP